MLEIIDYLKQRGMFVLNIGSEPHWMWSFGDKSSDWDKNWMIITIWFGSSMPAHIEISERYEGQYMFQGAIYNLNDLKYILYLITDCIDPKTGRPELTKIFK